MTRTTVTRTIDAPIELVFDTIANINNFAKAVPHIVKTEFVSDVTSGVGTRFRETRLMKGRQATTELEVTEYVPNDHVRIVSDTGGTLWDTVFTVRPDGGQTRLDMVMDAHAHKFIPKLINPLIKGVIKKAIEDDMDAVKAYCEK